MRRVYFYTFVIFSIFFSGCGVPEMDGGDPAGKQSIIDGTNLLLTGENCDAAVDLIEPLYNSSNTDNEVRLVRASAHGCQAGINYFNVLNALQGGSSSLSGSGLWELLAQTFPSSIGDSAMESSWFSQDALFATLNSGVVVPEIYQMNAGSYNVGSLQRQDRTSESSAYLVFAAMAAIGTTQNRFGDPDLTTFQKTQDLPWDSHDNMDESGCAYAGSIVNMLDGIAGISGIVSGATATALDNITTTFDTVITLACAFGCEGRAPDGTPGLDASCTFAASECTPCPLIMKNRTTCMDSQLSRCAAAGVVRFINDDPNGFGWQDNP